MALTQDNTSSLHSFIVASLWTKVLTCNQLASSLLTTCSRLFSSDRNKRCERILTTDLLQLVAGHFAERHFAERHFAERHFAERTFCRRTLCRTNILSNGQFDERTFRRKDILPKRQLAENGEILGVVTRTAYDWLLNKTSQSYNQFINLMTETLIVK